MCKDIVVKPQVEIMDADEYENPFSFADNETLYCQYRGLIDNYKKWGSRFGVYKKKCAVCGKIFFTKYSKQKYCDFGNKPRFYANYFHDESPCVKEGIRQKHRKWNEKNKKGLTLTKCAVCGDEFWAKRNDAKYCSNKCRQKDYRKRYK